MTPLHYAIVFGHREVVKQLLSLGARPELRDDHDKAALDHAISELQLDIAHDLRDWYAKSPLESAGSDLEKAVSTANRLAVKLRSVDKVSQPCMNHYSTPLINN